MMEQRQVAGVKVMNALDGVDVINICDLIPVLFGSDWCQRYIEGKFTYADQMKAVRSWCRDNNAHFYARGREEFNKYEAAEEALEKGLCVVVVEDLS